MNSSKFIFLFYFYLMVVKIQCLRSNFKTEIPENLKHIYVIYTSWFYIGENKPIITFEDLIYFNQGNTLKAFNYKDLFFSAASIFYPFGENYYIKPIDNYYLAYFNVYAMFFTKDCTLRSYNYVDKYFNYNNMNFKLDFNELKGEQCYDTLRMYYDFYSGFTSVYNIYSKKIVVFNLKNTYSYKSFSNYEKWFDKSMNGRISKALVFSKDFGEKIVLIGINILGQVNFQNIKGYCEGFINSFSCAYNDDLIESFQFKTYYTYYDEEIATIINKNKLLYINHNDFITFDLKEIKLINQQ